MYTHPPSTSVAATKGSRRANVRIHHLLRSITKTGTAAFQDNHVPTMESDVQYQVRGQSAPAVTIRMSKKTQRFTLLVAIVSWAFVSPASAKKGDIGEAPGAEITASNHPVLLRTPDDITSRNLYYGPGGKEHQPHGTFTFTKEDLDGTSPKLLVR